MKKGILLVSFGSGNKEAVEETLGKLKKEAEHLNAEIKRAEGMLSNERFVAKAPAEKVEAERKKLETYKQQLEIVQTRLQEIEK